MPPQLQPGVARWVHLVQIIIAHVVILPAHRVMQGMRTGIAPVAVQIELLQRSACARQLKQFAARQQSGFCAEYLGLCHSNLGRRHMGFILFSLRQINGIARAA